MIISDPFSPPQNLVNWVFSYALNSPIHMLETLCHTCTFVAHHSPLVHVNAIFVHLD